MSKTKVNKTYISEMDIFLHTLDQKFAKTESQLEEIAKHERIFQLRDNESPNDKQNPVIWEDF